MPRALQHRTSASGWSIVLPREHESREVGPSYRGSAGCLHGRTLVGDLSKALDRLMRIHGATAVAIVDVNSGMAMAKAGDGIDLDVAAAGNTEVVRAKRETIKAMVLRDQIEDILITLGRQYHIIRPLNWQSGKFIYLVLDKDSASLAMARICAAEVESELRL